MDAVSMMVVKYDCDTGGFKVLCPSGNCFLME